MSLPSRQTLISDSSRSNSAKTAPEAASAAGSSPVQKDTRSSDPIDTRARCTSLADAELAGGPPHAIVTAQTAINGRNTESRRINGAGSERLHHRLRHVCLRGNHRGEAREACGSVVFAGDRVYCVNAEDTIALELRLAEPLIRCRLVRKIGVG